MATLAKLLGMAALLVVALSTAPALAQNLGNPFGFSGNLGPPLNAGANKPTARLFNYGPPLAGAAMTSITPGMNPAATLINNNPYNNLYNNPYSYPGYNYYGDFGLGQTLYGAAAVIGSQGQFNIQNQQAKLIQQQAGQAQLDTRRKIYDEWLYERANTQSLEDRREQILRLELRRAMSDPPLTEILNGTSLDTVYKDLLNKQVLWPKGPNTTIDESVLKHLNLTTQSGGNVGLLKRVKDGEPLPWPAALKMEAYKKEVGQISKNLIDAVKLVEAGRPVDAGTIQNIRNDVVGLQTQLTGNINDLTPADCILAKRFLTQMDEAVTALQQPDVADYLSGRFAANGKTVTDLLQFMSSKGLTFGPAVPGDEAAYYAIHTYLVGYNTALSNAKP